MVFAFRSGFGVMNFAAKQEATDRSSVQGLLSRLRPYLYAVILMSSPGLVSGLGAECVSAGADFESEQISNFVQVLRDPGGRKSADEIAGEFAAGSSDIVLGGSVANFRGDDHAAYWLRFCIHTDSPPVREARDDLLLEYPDHRVDEISFYDAGPWRSGSRGGIVQSIPREIKTGSRHAFDTRDVPHPAFVFKLPLHSDLRAADRAVYLLRLRDGASIYGGLRLYTADAFRAHLVRENLLTGLYLGVIGVLLLCCLWFWYRDRNPGYPSCIALLASLGLYGFTESGAAIAIIQGDWPRWNEYVTWAAALSGFVAFVAFARTCLDTRRSLRRLDRWLRSLSIASLIAGGLCLLHLRDGGYVFWFGLMCLVAIAGLIVASVGAALSKQLIRRRRRSDLSFILALLFLMAGSLPHVLARSGIWLDPFSTRYVFQLGSIASMLLFFVGPGDRFRALRLERTAYQESARLKDSFLASMSHELRTPLNAMLGMSDLLYAAPLSHEHRGYLEVIRKSGDSMLRMVDSLLDMLSIEAGSMVLENIPFDLPRLINSASLSASELCAQKGLGFSVRFDEGLSRGFRGDPARLKQVIENVLDNAVKFTDRGSVLIEAGVKAGASPEPDFEEVVIRISDTGIGISEDRREDIFQSFTRVDESEARRTGGLGVGLTMVRSLVDLMGGHVSVRSEAGRGTVFRLHIPLRKAPELFAYERREAALRGEAVDDGAGVFERRWNGQRPLRILLVEDNRDNRLLFHAYMRSTKCEVDVATNGRRAVEKFKAELYDVVFMDIQMPELDGISATLQIRGWERHAFESGVRDYRVPIYALTAHSLAEEIQRSIEAGCDGHITKPVRKQEILQVLHHL